ncbi:chorismate mutase, partial [Xanthomonas campestris pv. nigromaculans]|nr:chorismate mutase [Xanthomonas campestris pv. nigromaculans]
MAPKSDKSTAATGGKKKPTKTSVRASDSKPAITPAEKAAIKTAAPVLADVRAKIDEIDRNIQALIAERANFAHQVGKAKGKLAAAVDYYRPEREAQVLRMVVDRNEGPL